MIGKIIIIFYFLSFLKCVKFEFQQTIMNNNKQSFSNDSLSILK